MTVSDVFKKSLLDPLFDPALNCSGFQRYQYTADSQIKKYEIEGERESYD
jgi:hypothetical protein